MKYFSFKILFFCMVLPPVLYLLTVQWVESSLYSRYSKEIETIHSVESKGLFEGSVYLKDAISRNIDFFLKKRGFLLRSADVDISVSTKQGALLYPAPFETEDTLLLTHDPLKVAGENYKLLNEGLVLNLSVTLGTNTPLSYLIFSVYTIISLSFLYAFYSKGLRKTWRESETKSREIDALLEKEEANKRRMELLFENREQMEAELKKVRDKLSAASRNEDGMIEEIVELEEKIKENLELQKTQQAEINELKTMIDHYRTVKKKGGKAILKGHDAISRRFKALYKNISVYERAVDGFIDLEEDLKIKCEEVIHQLNESPELVTIKRKVFGRKGRETVLEVIFGYKGRLYFRKTKENKVEILAVGTKNTQAKELEYLDRL